MKLIAGIDNKGAYIIDSLGKKKYFSSVPESAESYDDYRKREKKPVNDHLYKFRYSDEPKSNTAAQVKKEEDAINKRRVNKFTKNAIEDVIVNPPAVIVYWKDDTKTVVKCQKGDKFDAEKGLALAIIKYLFGNTGAYNTIFKYWLPIDDED